MFVKHAVYQWPFLAVLKITGHAVILDNTNGSPRMRNKLCVRARRTLCQFGSCPQVPPTDCTLSEATLFVEQVAVSVGTLYQAVDTDSSLALKRMRVQFLVGNVSGSHQVEDLEVKGSIILEIVAVCVYMWNI
jgi:hypothetical protein